MIIDGILEVANLSGDSRITAARTSRPIGEAQLAAADRESTPQSKCSTYYTCIVIIIHSSTLCYIISIVLPLHCMPNPPFKSFPIKSPRVELSGRPPIKFYGHENYHPLEPRACLSQTL